MKHDAPLGTQKPIAEHGPVDERRAQPVSEGAGPSREGLEENRVSHQDAHRGADQDPRSEVLPEAGEGAAERGPWRDRHGRQGEQHAQEKSRVRGRCRRRRRWRSVLVLGYCCGGGGGCSVVVLLVKAVAGVMLVEVIVVLVVVVVLLLVLLFMFL